MTLTGASLKTLNLNPNVKDMAPCLVMLSDDYMLIEATGEDAEAFLQGQFSNDLTLLNDNESQINAYCNPKGRAITIIHTFKASNGFWLLVPIDIIEKFLNRLKMFVMRAKVTFTQHHEKIAFGVVGDLTLPDNMASYCVKFKQQTRLVITNQESGLTYLHKNHTILFSSELWRYLQIISGIPQVVKNTTEKFIPQNINLDLVDGISFKKGCYPGQEIIARLKYLGKSKQRMISALIDTTAKLQAGDEIFMPEKPDQKSGFIVDAVRIAKNKTIASLMVNVALVKQGDMISHKTEFKKLLRLDYDYEIPAD